MRSLRLVFVFLAFYFVFLGGSAYYNLIFPVRVLHHIVVTLLLGVWLLARIRNGKGLPHTSLNRAIYAAVGVWFLSAAASIDPRMAFENLWFPLTHALFFFIVVDFLQRGQQRLVMETQFLLAALVVFISGLELASWYFGLGITPGTEVGWIDVIGPGTWLPLELPRLALAMNISTLLAGYVAPLITLAVGWALTARRRDYRRVLWLLAALLSVALVLTFSRGGILSAITGIGALAVVRLAQMPRVKRRIPPRSLIGAAALAGIAAAAMFTLITLSEARRSGDEGRLDMWVGAVEITRDHPLLGVGPGIYGRAFRDYRDPSIARDKLASAHNAYLNTAAETGVLGVVVSLWLAAGLALSWWKTWQDAASPARKIRVEATAAALLGVGVHSMVDVFTTTPVVLVILLLAAYSVTGHRSRLDTPPPGQRWPAVVGLMIVIGYGLFWFQVDRAQIHYQRSLSGNESALDEARAAAEIDPSLRLYSLQIAYLSGQRAAGDADLPAAIAAYEDALELEPTWATGWINLAALVARQGDVQAALAHLDRAWRIDHLNTAPLHWARLAEQNKLAADDAIRAAYELAIRRDIQNPDLPLAAFWGETDLRRRAMEAYAETLPLDWEYRVFAVHEPARAYALVPSNPQSAAEWWVLGEYALTVENDPPKAVLSFTRAIERSVTVGDYYVSRARAEMMLDPDAAARDLNIAQLLGTEYEYPNAVRARLAAAPDEAHDLRAKALPARVVGQEFAAVLYGRAAVFDVFPEMRRPGPGRAALQLWYEIAEQYVQEGRVEDAILAYRAILDYAPYEEEAREALMRLESE